MKTNAIISWIDEHGKYFSWVLIVCSIVFLVSCQIIACEHTNQRLLDEEIKYKTSPAALIEGFAKSVFDGFTLGLFSEDGVLTEYKKVKRWEDSVRIRDVASKQRLSFWMPIRNLSGVLLIISIPLYVYYRKRRHDLKTS